MIGVTFCFSSMDTVAKSLAAEYEPFFVVWARYVIQAVGVTVIFLPRLGSILKTEQLSLQIVRSALLFAATVFFFTSLSLLPLGTVTAVAQVVPLLITGMAAVVLAERVGIYRWGAVLIGFVGALIIVRPGMGGFGWAAVLPLAGAFCFAAYSIATRFLGARDSMWTTFFYTATAGALLASLAVPFFWETPAVTDLPRFLLMAALGASGQALLILAMSFAAASAVAPVFYVQLIFAAVLGFLFFGEVPDLWTVVGAATIVGAGLFVRWRERVRARLA